MRDRLIGGLVGVVTAVSLLLGVGAVQVSAQPSNDEDLVIEIDFADPALAPYVRQAMEEIADDYPRLSDGIRSLIGGNGIGELPPAVFVDFDGEVQVEGTVVTVTIPGSEIWATTNGWQGAIAATLGVVATVAVTGLCLMWAPEMASICGFLGGFFGELLSNVASQYFDGQLTDLTAWGNTLARSMVYGLGAAGLAKLTQPYFPQIYSTLVKLLEKTWEKAKHWWWHAGEVFWIVLWVFRYAGKEAWRLLTNAVGASTGCPPVTGADSEEWTRQRLIQNIRELLDRLRSMPGGTHPTPSTAPSPTPSPAPSTGTGTPAPGDVALRFADLDGDGLTDRLVNQRTGLTELSRNAGCDGNGDPVWIDWGNAAPVSDLLDGLAADQILFGDLDGDDRADYVALLNPNQSPTGIPSFQAWQNESSDGGINWGQGSRVANNLGFGSSVNHRMFADIDGDGDDDYITLDLNNFATAWENTARGWPAPGDWRKISGFGHPAEATRGQRAYFADITGDGRADTLLLDLASGDVQAWENLGGPWSISSGWKSLGTIKRGLSQVGLEGAVFKDLNGDRVADLVLFDGDADAADAWFLPRYGAGPQGPGQPGMPGFPTQLPAGTLPAYGGGDPQPQVTGRLIQNSNFTSDFKPWWVNAGMTPKVDGGVFCVNAPASAKPWDVIVGHNSIYLPKGKSYTFRFRVRTSENVNLTVQVAPFYNPSNTTYLVKYPTVTSGAWRQYEYTFDSTFSAEYMLSQVQFRLGGSTKPYEFCMDDVTLNGNGYVYQANRGPAVKVNQHGYLPRGPKRATLVSTATSPQAWTLRRVGGGTVATGQSTPAGFDGSAGASVHTIDFGSVTATGRFELVVGGQASHPFDIRTDLYASLRSDSMRFFYPNRSGIAIDGGIAGAAYARPAGHVAASPNGGDTQVPCQRPQSFMNNWTCDYTLDVTGGWYDAGDHGKYVVNGGIATYQLLSTWERAVAVGRSGPLGDSTLAIPERGNGVPDVLDEARWNLEFMLKMQVPAGKPLAGMVHHKVHDESWTGPPTLPHLDKKARQLHRPSTAATLNLAAVAAQGARVYAPYDAAFASRLRAAAERAYAAALANPVLYAPRADRSGGGPYADDDVTDEYYWAATQLYLTTSSGTYLTALRANRYHNPAVAFDQNGFYWGSVAALAQLDLARYGSGLSERGQIRTWVQDAANRLISFQRAERFGQSYTPTSGKYDWGSNASMLNNQVVIATAYDLTGNVAYADAVFEAFDYLFGRNALGQSYVTGYGSNDAKNQHSRWYAKSFDATLPNPPVGSVAGGPNSSLQDPLAANWLHGCAPQLCYVDNLEAWSVNEITINWNSALAWVSAFAADVAPIR